MGLTIAALLFILILIVIMKDGPAMWNTDEVVTTTTVTEEKPEINVVGPLKRQVEGDQFFVNDPVDQKKIWVNSNDDMYEDAAGKVWKLV